MLSFFPLFLYYLSQSTRRLPHWNKISLVSCGPYLWCEQLLDSKDRGPGWDFCVPAACLQVFISACNSSFQGNNLHRPGSSGQPAILLSCTSFSDQLRAPPAPAVSRSFIHSFIHSLIHSFIVLVYPEIEGVWVWRRQQVLSFPLVFLPSGQLLSELFKSSLLSYK